jgi:transposase
VDALEKGLRDQYKAGEWFMQDNAPIHTAKLSTQWLESHGVATINWPPYSSDLNPIEHMWWALKHKLHELYLEFDYIGDSLEEWERLRQDVLKKTLQR